MHVWLDGAMGQDGQALVTQTIERCATTATRSGAIFGWSGLVVCLKMALVARTAMLCDLSTERMSAPWWPHCAGNEGRSR